MPIDRAGFTGRGKPSQRLKITGFVKGHDFSRADKANKINRALAPAKVGAQEIAPEETAPAACLGLRYAFPLFPQFLNPYRNLICPHQPNSAEKLRPYSTGAGAFPRRVKIADRRRSFAELSIFFQNPIK